MSMISDIEAGLTLIKALEALGGNQIAQTDIKSILADFAQAKLLFLDGKTKLEELLAQLTPEVKTILDKVVKKG